MSDSLPVLYSSMFGAIDRLSYDRKIRAIGIDLGTTNSVVAEAIFDPAIVDSLEVNCLEVEQETIDGPFTNTLLPSVVAVLNGRKYIGEGAKRLRYDVTKYGLVPYETIFFDCKNDIGNRRTYPKGVLGITSSVQVASEILKKIEETIKLSGHQSSSQYVITVPASFQNSQRRETAEAAKRAGIEILPGRMIDEPVAAFIDFLRTHPKHFGEWRSGSRKVLVFDFGGGTCDIAVVTFTLSRERGQIDLGIHAVSRFHRLGGSDIDQSIVHNVLIPQLCSQNEIDPHSLGFQDKFRRIGPSLIGLAESLKVKLCGEIRSLESFGRYDQAAKSGLVVRIPGETTCHFNGRLLKLSSAELSVSEFEKILSPFLDSNLLFPQENEYYMTQSIFAPILDALDRADLDKTRIDYCLAVGGSSLIPQVRSELTNYFGKDKVVTFDRNEDIQNCVARGAAYYSLFCFHYGKPPIRQVLNDGISLRTESGPMELVARGTPLPYPSDGAFARYTDLAVSRTVIDKPLELSVELISSGDERELAKSVWKIDRPVSRGERIRIEFRIDENQLLELRAKIDKDSTDTYFEMRIENPLTNVVNPAPKRLKMEELEEQIRSGLVNRSEIEEKLEELGEIYVDLGFIDKAIECLKRVLKNKGQADVAIMNRLANLYGRQGDYLNEEKLYRQAAKIDTWSGTWFNLALSQNRRKDFTSALDSIGKAIDEDDEAPFFVLRAQIELSMDNQVDAEKSINDAKSRFSALDSMDDFELTWFELCCQISRDKIGMMQANNERKKRKRAESQSQENMDKVLPIRLPGTPRKPE